MRFVTRLVLFVVLSALLTSCAYLGGYGTALILHPAPQTAVSETSQDNFRVFWEAWRIVQEEYYAAPLEPAELTYGAVRGAVAALGDPYTWFADPEEAALIKEQAEGRYYGIGAVVNENEAGHVVIVHPFPGSPAAESGLLPGDVILEVEGTETQGLSLEESVSLIRGPAGTSVHLLVQRQDVEEPFEVDVVRAEIEIPVVEYELLDDGIAYLKINNFHAPAPDQVHEALVALLAQEPKGLVIDLRDDPGGLLTASVDVASEFIAEGVIVTERGSNGLEEEHVARGGGLAAEMPLVVLVNGGSASASEIVAGAIRDHGRGILIGEATLGKGAVQSPLDLSDGSHLRLTIAQWFTPNGQLIEGEGLAPDIEIALTEEDLAEARDPQLDRAISYLLGR
jgi:carboxyl-terminal processing protease